MLLLALESSTALGSVALIQDGKILGEESSPRKRSHSEFLNSALSRLCFSLGIELKQIDQIAVTTGPGSFTGVRVAGSLAKSVAYSLNKKIWAVDSLTVLASMLSPQFSSSSLVAIDAFKNMIYASCFAGPKRLIGPTVVDLKDLEDFVLTHLPQGLFSFAGDAMPTMLPFLSPVTRSRISSPGPAIENPTASTLGQLFFSHPQRGQTLDWKSFVPLYLRGSEAEENLRLRASEK